MLDNHMVMYSELPRKASYICKGCNEVIYDDYFDSFEKKLKADIKISKSDIYTYCKEEKPKRGFMIACISLGIILFGEFFALLLLNYYKLKFKN